MPRLNAVGQESGILSNPGEAPGAPGVLPRETKKIDTWDGGNSASVTRIPFPIEDWNFNPTIVGAKAYRPNDHADLCFVIV